MDQFGAGDENFAKEFQSLGIEVQRIINIRDVVTSIPGLSVTTLQQVSGLICCLPSSTVAYY